MQINNTKLFDDFFKKSTDRKINFLVLHHIKSDGLNLAIKELKKHKVSSHYAIDEDGTIYQLVLESDIAYHAGISYWDKKFNLNNESIGIEFISTNPYKDGFSDKQISSGIKLCHKIIDRYKIKPKNIVGHSDIAYDKKSGFLNRKDDPSNLFPWDKFAKNNISIWPNSVKEDKNDGILFKNNDSDPEIAIIKHKLAKFGYKINNFDKKFDQEFISVTTVFNRRFNVNKDIDIQDKWLNSSSKALEELGRH